MGDFKCSQTAHLFFKLATGQHLPNDSGMWTKVKVDGEAAFEPGKDEVLCINVGGSSKQNYSDLVLTLYTDGHTLVLFEYDGLTYVVHSWTSTSGQVGFPPQYRILGDANLRHSLLPRGFNFKNENPSLGIPSVGDIKLKLGSQFDLRFCSGKLLNPFPPSN